MFLQFQCDRCPHFFRETAAEAFTFSETRPNRMPNSLFLLLQLPWANPSWPVGICSSRFHFHPLPLVSRRTPSDGRSTMFYSKSKYLPPSRSRGGDSVRRQIAPQNSFLLLVSSFSLTLSIRTWGCLSFYTIFYSFLAPMLREFQFSLVIVLVRLHGLLK